MPEAKLRATLDDLQRQLDAGGPLSAEEAEELEAVRDRIERLLEQTQETRKESLPVVQTEVGGVLERFEAEHPELARVLNMLATTLSSLGI